MSVIHGCRGSLGPNLAVAFPGNALRPDEQRTGSTSVVIQRRHLSSPGSHLRERAPAPEHGGNGDRTIRKREMPVEQEW